ncbi:hypothetical protein J1N35_016278 [Gossypium stocksii]|uniref:Uncharacterized protein n=1 Tax=Gossypium stocksii TaxID=47602 RepID=A0A9D4A4V4_9ROSI|nr:hypothetical protein J1N35_016278 [Gossypium stocksii]
MLFQYELCTVLSYNVQFLQQLGIYNLKIKSPLNMIGHCRPDIVKALRIYPRNSWSEEILSLQNLQSPRN